MYAIGGKCIKLDRHQLLQKQIENILETNDSLNDKLALVMEVRDCLSSSGDKTILNEEVFYDYWKVIAWFRILELDEITEYLDLHKNEVGMWHVGEDAPDGASRRGYIVSTISFMIKKLKAGGAELEDLGSDSSDFWLEGSKKSVL